MGGSAAQDVLDQLVDVLAAAGPPRPVVTPIVSLADESPDAPPPPVAVRVLSLDRVGRSQRRGPLLDLSMLVEVTTSGPHALEYAEQLFVAVERSPWPVSTRPLTPASVPPAPAAAAGYLGFWIQLTFSVPVPQPAPPLVQQPPEVQISVSSEGSTGW